jgi:hypothetical protein
MRMPRDVVRARISTPSLSLLYSYFFPSRSVSAQVYLDIICIFSHPLLLTSLILYKDTKRDGKLTRTICALGLRRENQEVLVDTATAPSPLTSGQARKERRERENY